MDLSVAGTPHDERRQHATAALVDGLSRCVLQRLANVLPVHTPCALLDFPMISNVGDSAIWLGERRALRALKARIIYMADMGGFVPERLAATLGRGVILLQGGGTFGDLWPEHQLFREAVVAAFPRHRIIQLPQTINFQRRENLARARLVLNRHQDLTLLLRDQRSFEFARNEFGAATSFLCPDMAFALGPLSRPGFASVDILALTRSDHEARRVRPELRGEMLLQDDWIGDPKGGGRVLWKVLRRLSRCRRTVASARNTVLHPYDLLARQRLAYGSAFLGRGRVVITDRLHGHILCLLLGIPHVLVDDEYSKIKSFYTTWTKGSELSFWADPHEDPLAIAAERLRTESLSPLDEERH